MKTFTRITAVVILAVMVLSLVACSSFGGIKANFEKNGYTYVEDADSENTTKTITAELEEGDISCTAHLFKIKIGEVPIIGTEICEYALVLEFGSDKDMQEAMAESETIKGIIKDAQDSEYVNGNCLLVPIGLTKFEEMVKIFNGEKLD